MSVLVDLGSIAKGFIADRMAEQLRSDGVVSGLVDARGDIRVFGRPQIINVQHPRKKGRAILAVKIKNSGIATSGDYSQYQKTYSRSHIINQADLISVTVVAPTLMEADAYATAIFVSGRAERQRLISQNRRIKVLTIDNKLQLRKYNGFAKLVEK